jgi:hypothetical protein
MTSKDFIIWLKGFTEGVHQYNITPVQWEILKEQLNKVDDTPYVSDNFTIGPYGAYERDPNQFPFGTPNFAVTTGHTGTAVAYSFPGTTVHYTASSGSAFSYTNTTNDKTLLND